MNSALVDSELEHILKGVCEATHTKYEFQYIEGYPALINLPGYNGLCKADKLGGSNYCINCLLWS